MSPLSGLALATASFVGSHLLLSHPLRAPTVRALGERGFLGLYSLVAFATLGWTVMAARQAPAEPLLWIAPPGAWHGATLIMLVASILLVGSLSGNPAMVDPQGNIPVPQTARGVYAITRHPMMWSFILWAAVHALLWGSAANLILTGGIALLSLVGALGQDRKKARLLGQSWRDWQRRTSFVPFAALLTGRARWSNASPGPVPLVGGLLLWLGATWAHPPMGGPVVGPWMWTG